MKALKAPLALLACAVAGCPNSVGTTTMPGNGSGSGESGEEGEHGSPGRRCEEDEDCDGFRDEDDPSPSDENEPGKFSSLEAVLEDSRVRVARAELEQQGYRLVINEGSTPNLECGTFRSHDGQVVASGNGANVGELLADSESQLTPLGDNRIQVEGFIYWNGETLGTFSSIVNVRGTGDATTTWSTGSDTCVPNGARYTSYWVSIGSTAVETSSQGEIGRVSLTVTVATRGEPTWICDERKVGDSELVGGWAAILEPEPEQVGPCSQR